MINSQNNDINECLKCCLVRYLYPEDPHRVRIPKVDKDFARVLYLKDIRFPVKIRDIYKIEKTNSIGISVFGYENKEKHPIYVSKKRCEKNIITNRKRKQKTVSSYRGFHLCMIIRYIEEENIIAGIVCKLSVQKKN